MEFKIGDTVRALVNNDGIDILNMNIPYEVFNFIEFESRVGIRNGSHWYYLKPEELEFYDTEQLDQTSH